MSQEKIQSAGTATADAPGENTVQITFLPEGKTVEFEHGSLPYKDHGKEESILDVALNYGVRLDHACGGNCACTTCHVWVSCSMSSSGTRPPLNMNCMGCRVATPMTLERNLSAKSAVTASRSAFARSSRKHTSNVAKVTATISPCGEAPKHRGIDRGTCVRRSTPAF